MNNLWKLTRCVLLFSAMGITLVTGCDSSNPTASDSSASSSSSLPRLDQSASTTASNSTAVVKRGDITGQITARARVAAAVEQPLFFPRSGWIKSLNVKIGEQVGAGAVLAEIEDPDLQNQLQTAEAAVETAQIALAQAQIPVAPGKSAQAAVQITMAESGVEIAKLKLDKLKTPPTEEDLVASRVAVEKARAQVTIAQNSYDLVAFKSGPDKANAAVSLQMATLDLQVAEANLTRLVRGPRAVEIALAEADVRSAEAALKQAKANYDYETGIAQVQASQREASIRARETDLKLREAERDRLTAKTKDLRLSAPFGGNIVSLDIKLGDKVSPFQTLGILADPSDLEVAALVDEEVMPLVSLGQAAETLIDGFPGQKHRATVKTIASKPTTWQGKQAYEVRLGFADKSKVPATIRMGSDVYFTIAKSKVLVVPLAALQGSARDQYVEVLAGSSKTKVSVNVGLTNDREAEVTSGLREGAAVVLRSAQ